MKNSKILLSSLTLATLSMCSILFAENIVAPSDFFDKATARDTAEIESSKLALHNSTSPDVIAYAYHMIAEHTANTEEIAKLAMHKNISLKSTIQSADNIKAFIARQIDANSFDLSYAKHQVVNHQRSIILFRHAILSDDKEVSAFAKLALPKLLHHLYLAQKLVETTSN